MIGGEKEEITTRLASFVNTHAQPRMVPYAYDAGHANLPSNNNSNGMNDEPNYYTGRNSNNGYRFVIRDGLQSKKRALLYRQMKKKREEEARQI